LLAAGNQAAVCDNTGVLLGGFSAGYYWSSSQDAADAFGVWYQSFDEGSQHARNKNVTVRVRPVRAF
jgi:hypothetical protein